MLTKRLCSVFKNQYIKCLSMAPLPKIENEAPVETENPKEKEMLQHPDYFKVHNLFTVKDLFQARVHYGHKASSLHQNMKPFVFGSRLGHVIFDLDITAFHLREALNFAAHIAYRDGIILFVSKNPEVTLLVEKTAKLCGEFAVTREFLLGLFTNSDKKFNTQIRLPDLVILLNTIEESGHQHQAVVESAKMCIPTIGIVDSNCNPNLITYPVPGNDDTYSCFELYCKLFSAAILRGKAERKEGLKETAKTKPNKATQTDVPGGIGEAAEIRNVADTISTEAKLGETSEESKETIKVQQSEATQTHVPGGAAGNRIGSETTNTNKKESVVKTSVDTE